MKICSACLPKEFTELLESTIRCRDRCGTKIIEPIHPHVVFSFFFYTMFMRDSIPCETAFSEFLHSKARASQRHELVRATPVTALRRSTHCVGPLLAASLRSRRASGATMESAQEFSSGHSPPRSEITCFKRPSSRRACVGRWRDEPKRRQAECRLF